MEVIMKTIFQKTIVSANIIFYLVVSISYANTNIRGVVVMFQSGIVAVKNTNTVDPVSSEVVKHNDILQILGENGVTEIRRAVPSLNASDTLKTLPNGQTVKLPDLSNIYFLALNDEEKVNRLRNELKEFSEVVYTEVAYHAQSTDETDDPEFDQQWYLDNNGSLGGTEDADISAPEAWEIFNGSEDIIVGMVEATPAFEEDNDDLTGRRAGSLFWMGEDNNHAVMTTGIIVANTNNQMHIAGADWNAKFFAAPHNNDLPDGALDATVEATDAGAKIINNSWSEIEDVFITLAYANLYSYYSDVLNIAAMGNQASSQTRFPAGYSDIVLSVGATDWFDVHPDFSNTGDHIDLVAPGGDGADITVGDIISINNSNSTERSWGTSFSAPLVSGVASLLRGFRPDLYNVDIEHILKISADKVDEMSGVEWTDEYGYGRVNAKAALDYVQLPYEITRFSTASGYEYSNTSQEQWAFIGVDGLYPYQGYIAIRYEVRKDVQFNETYAEPVHVWHQLYGSKGYSKANPNLGIPWSGSVPGTESQNSVTLRTYVYKVWTNSGTYLGWYPNRPENVEFYYTVHGRREITNPTSLTLTLLDIDEVRVQWYDASDNEMGFYIERSTDGTNFNVVGTLVTNGNGTGNRTYTDSGLSYGITYYYRVRAYAQSFTSGYSNVSSVNTSTPAMVQNLTAEGGVMHIELNWDQAANATSYNIFSREGETGNFVFLTNTTNSNCIHDIDNYTIYYFYKVYGVNSGLEGPPSQVVSAQALHMASRTPTATAYSNARKVVNHNGTYHMVYEDNSEIYYTYSTDDGLTWAPEEVASFGFGVYKNPSIAVDYWRNVHLTFEEHYDSWMEIWYAKMEGGNFIDYWSVWDDGFETNDTYTNAYPSIAASNYMNTLVSVAFKAPDGIWVTNWYNGEQISSQKVPNTDEGSTFPSIVSDPSGANKQSIVWQQNYPCDSKI